jgi:REP element-mobilizing transposase RayT
MWNLQPPPGFQGLREDKPLEVYMRHLPHWRQEGATYFVTFRLDDSLPKAKLDQLAAMRHEWERLHPSPWGRDALERLARQQAEYLEKWLDEGMGSCLLKEPSCAVLLTEAMHHFDRKRYELGAYVVMTNHVHVIVRPLACMEHPLEKIIGSWKQYSGKRINARRETKGDLWQQESYDRIVRDEEHLHRCLQYIGRNPAKAGLTRNDCPLWIRPEWVALGWKVDEM